MSTEETPSAEVDDRNLDRNSLRLEFLTEQYKLQREAGLLDPITIRYDIVNDEGDEEERSLIFALPQDISHSIGQAHANRNYRAMIELCCGIAQATMFFDSRQRREVNGESRIEQGPTHAAVSTLWEIVAIEYGLFTASGLLRLDEAYKLYRQAQRKQRKMLGQSTRVSVEAKERKKKRKKKAGNARR